MDQVSANVMNEWREEVCRKLHYQEKDNIIKLVNPCRRPHDCGLTDREVFDLDMKDIRGCDIILADIRFMPRENTGTASEIFYASEILKKPVIGWKGNAEVTARRIFLNVLCAQQFDELEDAIDHILNFYVE